MDLILSDQEIEREFRVYDRAGLVRRMTFESFVAARRADVDLDERVRIDRIDISCECSRGHHEPIWIGGNLPVVLREVA